MSEQNGAGLTVAVEKLEAFEAATTLKARYFRLMDLKQWDAWQALYAADAVLDMRGEIASMAELGIDVGDPADWILRSPDLIRQSVEAALEGVTSVHHGHMAECEMVGPDRISVIWAMEDVIHYPAGRPVAGFHGYGHYHDLYVRQDGQWLIESVVLKRLLISPIPHAST
jgi:hypothetical protein